ncbi:MAG: hypothetical protein O3A95_05885 [Planctomycetota bacterium]|nr:hypothetical protein [Planctomycetota bacterium]
MVQLAPDPSVEALPGVGLCPYEGSLAESGVIRCIAKAWKANQGSFPSSS